MEHLTHLKQELTVVYQVSDRKATTAWYQKHFGFELEYDVEEIGWCELKSTLNQVWLGLSEVEEPNVKGGATLTWGTQSVDKSRQYLESEGVKFDGETRVIPGMVKLATFFDPDGNHLMLAENLSQQEA
jgi:predicted enzyme related to lactoylglutathione lyase